MHFGVGKVPGASLWSFGKPDAWQRSQHVGSNVYSGGTRYPRFGGRLWMHRTPIQPSIAATQHHRRTVHRSQMRCRR